MGNNKVKRKGFVNKSLVCGEGDECGKINYNRGDNCALKKLENNTD